MLSKIQKLQDFLYMSAEIGGRISKSLASLVLVDVSHSVRDKIPTDVTNSCRSYMLIEDWMDEENKC